MIINNPFYLAKIKVIVVIKLIAIKNLIVINFVTIKIFVSLQSNYE